MYVHWTFPAGGLFVAYFLGDVTWLSALCLIFAYSTLILVHEFGHAFAAKYFSHNVRAVLLTGAGGWCLVDEPDTFGSKAAFYSGGLVAQFLALCLVTILLVAFGNPESLVLSSFVVVFTAVNVVLMVINIIPYKGNDGEALWALIRDRRTEP